MPLKNDAAYIEALAMLLCLEAGDSWYHDDGAADGWRQTVSEFIDKANAVEKMLAKKTTQETR